LIKARNKEEACKIAQAAYESSEIVLGAEDFVCADFKMTIADEQKTEI
jgi:protein dpnD